MEKYVPVVPHYEINFFKDVTANSLTLDLYVPPEQVAKALEDFKVKNRSKMIVTAKLYGDDGELYTEGTGVYLMLPTPDPK